MAATENYIDCEMYEHYEQCMNIMLTMFIMKTFYYYKMYNMYDWSLLN